MWDAIKKGFGYSFGGAIGWRLGNLVFNLLSRVWKFAAAALAAWFISFNVVPQSVRDDAQRDYEHQKAKIEKKVAQKTSEKLKSPLDSGSALGILNSRNH
jgi:hypothetical protein